MTVVIVVSCVTVTIFGNCLSLSASSQQFNFIGKLLGPRGQSLKWLQEQTHTKMAILGKGSMRDKQKVIESLLKKCFPSGRHRESERRHQRRWKTLFSCHVSTNGRESEGETRRRMSPSISFPSHAVHSFTSLSSSPIEFPKTMCTHLIFYFVSLVFSYTCTLLCSLTLYFAIIFVREQRRR